MASRFSRRVLTAATLATALVCCAFPVLGHASDETPPATSSGGSEVFPEIEQLRPNVEFWKRVFSEWSLGQAVVHDLEHLGLIYEVVELPGEIEESYTREQQDFLEDLRESWEDRLHDLQRRVAKRAELLDDEKQLALQVATHAGTTAIKGAYQRVRTQRGLRERFARGLEISGRYDGLLREVFREAGLPEDLAVLPHVESSFQSSARSSAGAVGAWQFTWGTGRRYLRITSAIDERLDPVAAARGAAAYLGEAYEKLDSWPLAITAYNHGVRGMQRAEQKLGSDLGRIYSEYRGRTFGFASRNFYAEFLAAREIVANPEWFFPEGLTPEPPLDRDWLELERPASPGRLARLYGVPLDALAEINPAWTSRGVRRGLALPAGTRVWLPRDALARAGSVAGSGGEVYYLVEAGDSLWAIAEEHGISLELLLALNGLGPREDRIYPGQRLVVVEQEGPDNLIHTVLRGDTLSKIAVLYGVRLGDLLALNQLSRRSVIYPGQQIVIPPLR